jgi:hypothetical protein
MLTSDHIIPNITAFILYVLFRKIIEIFVGLFKMHKSKTVYHGQLFAQQ